MLPVIRRDEAFMRRSVKPPHSAHRRHREPRLRSFVLLLAGHPYLVLNVTHDEFANKDRAEPLMLASSGLSPPTFEQELVSTLVSI